MLLLLALYFVWRGIPVKKLPPAGVTEAKVVHGWLSTWANEHEGRLPDKVEDVLKIDVGADPSYFHVITEYRGAGKYIDDTSSNAVLRES